MSGEERRSSDAKCIVADAVAYCGGCRAKHFKQICRCKLVDDYAIERVRQRDGAAQVAMFAGVRGRRHRADRRLINWGGGQRLGMTDDRKRIGRRCGEQRRDTQ